MRDDERLPIVEETIEGWKAEWNGVDSYARVLTFASFVFVGFGLGTIDVAQQLFVAFGSVPDGSATIVRTRLAAATAGFVSCQGVSWLLSSKVR